VSITSTGQTSAGSKENIQRRLWRIHAKASQIRLLGTKKAASIKKRGDRPPKKGLKTRSYLYLSQEEHSGIRNVDEALLVDQAPVKNTLGSPSTPLDVAAAMDLTTTSAKFRMIGASRIAVRLDDRRLIQRYQITVRDRDTNESSALFGGSVHSFLILAAFLVPRSLICDAFAMNSPTTSLDVFPSNPALVCPVDVIDTYSFRRW